MRLVAIRNAKAGAEFSFGERTEPRADETLAWSEQTTFDWFWRESVPSLGLSVGRSWCSPELVCCYDAAKPGLLVYCSCIVVVCFCPPKFRLSIDDASILRVHIWQHLLTTSVKDRHVTRHHGTIFLINRRKIAHQQGVCYIIRWHSPTPLRSQRYWESLLAGNYRSIADRLGARKLIGADDSRRTNITAHWFGRDDVSSVVD